MATINWPTELPQVFLKDGFSQGMDNNYIQDDFDYGPAGRRRRSTTSPYPVQGQMEMDDDQWVTLWDFCKTTLLSRVLPFGFPAQYQGDETEWLVRFTEMPTRQRMDIGDEVMWLVSISLEVLPS